MDLPVNTFKRAIKAGRQQIGLWSSLSSHLSVELLAGSGFDWLLLDTEHAPNDLPMVLSQLQATEGGTAHPIVRPPWNDPVLVKRYLDAGASRASRYGRIKDYYERCEAELCVLVQIETRLALQNLEAIAGVEGVDGVFIGPGDLSADMGYLGQPGHPDVIAAIDDAIGRIRACGSVAGILTGNEQFARHFIEQGCLFTAVGSDVGILAQASEQLAARFKA
jgi:4-hydroxy-2-oxoheptanedioate aldolase